MNILLTGAGRRNFLVHFFRAALAGRGRVIACDSSPAAPALADADESIVVPSMDHPEYFDVLCAICREKRVRLIVPVNDLEIAGLARNATRFRDAGAIALVPSPEIVEVCSDKWSTFLWLREHGITTPRTFPSIAAVNAAMDAGLLRFPLLIKPRWGTSSVGIERIENKREMELAHEWGKIQLRRTILAKMTRTDPDRAFVFQEYIEGEEYGMDVINDFNGNYAATLVRKKLSMRAGNTDRAVSASEPRLSALGETLARNLRHAGSIDCDVMMAENRCYVLDVNPRLGGGYPFSHMAGANLPAALIAWTEGTQPDPAWLCCEPGIQSSRYDGLAVARHAMPAIAHAAAASTSFFVNPTLGA